MDASKRIDINCDLGEGLTIDQEIMPLISSCNIACGGHAGDTVTMQKAVESAIKNQVAIGAHPSYPDRINFGRKSMDLPLKELEETLTSQIRSLIQITNAQKGKVVHIKPHGALYNDLKTDQAKTELLVGIVKIIDSSLTLFVPPHSVIETCAQKEGLQTRIEGFGDRTYQKNFSLQPRGQDGAVITDKEKVFQQVLNMVIDGTVKTFDGAFLNATFDTICIHSDTSDSLGILKLLNERLPLNGILIGA